MSSNDLIELPKGWAWKSIGNICSTTSGGTPLRKFPSYYNGKIPWIKSGELNNSIVSDSQEMISEEGLKNSSAKTIPKGTILIALYGATTGRLGILGIDAAINQAICAIFPREGLDKTFLFYYLLKYRDELLNSRKGGAQPNISQQIINDITFPLPPLPEQHRIVAKIEELFTRLDAGVEELKKIKVLLKRYRQSVLKSAFEGKLTAEWREAHKDELEPASVLLEKIKEERKKNAKDKYKELPAVNKTDLTELPEGWEWTRVGEIAEKLNPGFPSGIHNKERMGIPHIRPMNINSKGQIDLTDIKYVESCECDTLMRSDVLFNNTNSPEWLGKTAYIGRDTNWAYSNHMTRIRLNNAFLNPAWVSYCLYTLFCRGYFKQNCIHHVNQASINSTYLSERVFIPLPSLIEQNRIVQEMEHHFSIVDEIEKTIENGLKQSERLRQSILKRAFEGKLVPKDPNDEPAEKLLERIKKVKHINKSK